MSFWSKHDDGGALNAAAAVLKIRQFIGAKDGKRARTDDNDDSSEISVEEAENLLVDVPRLVAIQVANELTYEEVNRLCSLSKRFALRFCAISVGEGDVPDEDLRNAIWEIWEAFLKRDFGVAYKASECASQFRVARELVARSMTAYYDTAGIKSAAQNWERTVQMRELYEKLYKSVDRSPMFSWLGFKGGEWILHQEDGVMLIKIMAAEEQYRCGLVSVITLVESFAVFDESNVLLLPGNDVEDENDLDIRVNDNFVVLRTDNGLVTVFALTDVGWLSVPNKLAFTHDDVVGVYDRIYSQSFVSSISERLAGRNSEKIYNLGRHEPTSPVLLINEVGFVYHKQNVGAAATDADNRQIVRVSPDGKTVNSLRTPVNWLIGWDVSKRDSDRNSLVAILSAELGGVLAGAFRPRFSIYVWRFRGADSVAAYRFDFQTFFDINRHGDVIIRGRHMGIFSDSAERPRWNVVVDLWTGEFHSGEDSNRPLHEIQYENDDSATIAARNFANLPMQDAVYGTAKRTDLTVTDGIL